MNHNSSVHVNGWRFTFKNALQEFGDILWFTGRLSDAPETCYLMRIDSDGRRFNVDQPEGDVFWRSADELKSALANGEFKISGPRSSGCE